MAVTHDDFGRETDEWGHIKDPAERYQVFMLGLHDMLADAGDYGYSQEACELLAKARLTFMDEFEARHPGYGKAEPYGDEGSIAVVGQCRWPVSGPSIVQLLT